MSKNKKKEEKKNKLKTLGYATGSAYIGQNAIKSGLPRMAGVRLESHSTSKKNARSIIQNGGWLNPKKGGSGASLSINNKDFIEASKNYVHITGRHGISHPLVESKSYRVGPGGVQVEIPGSTKYVEAPKNPIYNVLHRKNQRGLYRGIVGENLQNLNSSNVLRKSGPKILLGALGLKGKTLYIGGTDKFFDQNFIPDTDDLALKSSKPIKVYSNRFKATAATIKKEGLANLMKANKGRVAAGAALTVGGLGAAGYMAKKALENVGPVKVKSFVRKGKRVKAHMRK